jgi:DNA-binding response OmpR family regulator
MSEAAYTVLAVDDDAVNRMMLSALIEQEGYSVRTAVDGAEALRVLAEEPIDAVLLDLVMPGLDGAAVLRSIKADSRLMEVPVIMVSAVEDQASVLQCLDMGAADYLHKPFDPEHLRARLSACLAKNDSGGQEGPLRRLRPGSWRRRT